MSNALMCDSCGNIFPEGAEGSVSGNGTFTRTVDGVRKELQKRQDQCPECAQEQAQRWNGARTIEAPKRTVPPAVEPEGYEPVEGYAGGAFTFERGGNRGMQP